MGLSDRVIADIANDIETEEQAESLGRALGFSQAAINRYLATNRVQGRVTSKGTRDMLFAWRQNTLPANHQTTLKAALQKAGLILLAFKHLRESFISDGDANFLTSEKFRRKTCKNETLCSV